MNRTNLKNLPPHLKAGDCVGIVCPAGEVRVPMTEAIRLFKSWGLEVRVGRTVGSRFHHFSATDSGRCADLQEMLNDPAIKAIFAARGGYGTVRIIDALDFSRFVKRPKWIIGYSDITVLHMHIQTMFGIPTIHGHMPNTIPGASKTSLLSLKGALFGERLEYNYTSRFENREGTCQGILIGGNLAILASILGSVSDPDYDGKILFIEDVAEYHYSIDRLIWMLKRARKFRNLKGLIVGGFTALKDEASSFGLSVHEIIMDSVQEFDYPVATDFPAGHIRNHKTLIFGENVNLTVNKNQVALNY